MQHPNDEEIAAAQEQGDRMLISEPRAVSAQYTRETGRVTVELASGCTYIFPADLVQDLHNSPADKLATITIDGMGFNLHWPDLDVDLFVPALISGVFGTESWMKEHLSNAELQSDPQGKILPRQRKRRPT